MAMDDTLVELKMEFTHTHPLHPSTHISVPHTLSRFAARQTFLQHGSFGLQVTLFSTGAAKMLISKFTVSILQVTENMENGFGESATCHTVHR